MSFILLSCSVWLLVAMVTDRIISVWKSSKNDNKHSLLVSNKVTYISISAICFVCFLIHVTKFAEYKPNSNLYSPKLVQKTDIGRNQVYEVYSYLANLVLSVMLPMMTLLFAVGFFIYRFIRYGTVFNKNRVVLNNNSNINLLMLCLSAFYVICHALGLFFMFKTILPMVKNAVNIESLAILRTVNELMVLGYVALKFFIYLFFVQNFKGTLKDLLLCKRMAEYRLPPDGNGQDVISKTMPVDSSEMEGMCETQCSFENPVYGTKVDG
ncbi:hypothetical protein KUTeg_004900 [Tegillarca granosa]|uniref:G-protein coupled receptors family 1 profile domain-containing protein n=1 Tax=Tegillarca granosa TaxID=220873 RepID=A0ABQ9FK14_TEGGR|nr:hypothetical protein KUTeg_004900 [Tegillarca granosa]